MFNIVEELVKDSGKRKFISNLDYELVKQYCCLKSIEIDDNMSKTYENVNNFLSKQED